MSAIPADAGQYPGRPSLLTMILASLVSKLSALARLNACFQVLCSPGPCCQYWAHNICELLSFFLVSCDDVVDITVGHAKVVLITVWVMVCLTTRLASLSHVSPTGCRSQ